MTPFSRYIFVKTDMSGVEQADLSNREYSPDSYLCYHLAAEQSLNVGKSAATPTSPRAICHNTKVMNIQTPDLVF